MCLKVVNTYYFSIQFASNCYKTQEMSYEAVNKYFLAFIYIFDGFKTQETCDSYFWSSFYAILFSW